MILSKNSLMLVAILESVNTLLFPFYKVGSMIKTLFILLVT